MEISVCLNVLRHPAIPVPRGEESYDQLIDPAFHIRNDDIHPEDGPAGVVNAIPSLLLDPGRPVLIRHSTAVRARKGAELFAEHLARDYEVRITEDHALSELEYRRDRLWHREQHDRVSSSWQSRMAHFYRPILVDGEEAAPFGRRLTLERLASLRRTLAASGPANHLWVSHGLAMPFIYLALVENLPTDTWTLEAALKVGRFGYAAGFHVRVAVEAIPAGQ